MFIIFALGKASWGRLMWAKGYEFVCYTLPNFLTKILYQFQIMLAKQMLIMKKAHITLKKNFRRSWQKQNRTKLKKKKSFRIFF